MMSMAINLLITFKHTVQLLRGMHILILLKQFKEQAAKGVLFGTPTELEIEFSKKLRDAIPSLEKIRFVNSGTEAVMTTIRVARAYTKRSKIIKFAGSLSWPF